MNRQATTSNPLLHSVKKAGELLGLSPWTIRQWCYTGRIASHKIGTRLMVSQDSIDQLLSDSLRPRVEDAHQ
jgi:excisionase family DNA binding protein